MKKKGFTLIELLGVVIVLAVIAVVSVPIVIDVIENAKSSANKSSVYGMIDAAKMYYSESMLDENKKLNVEKLNDIYEYVTLNGEKPEGGKLYVNDKGQVAVQVIINDTCYMKDFTGELEEIKDYSECDLGIVGTDENKPEVEIIVNTNPQYNGWYNEQVYVNIREVNETKTGEPTIEFILKDTESGILSYKWCIGNSCTPSNESTDLNKTLILIDSKETQVCIIAIDKSLKESEKVCTDIIKQDITNPIITGIADIKISVNGEYNLEENVKIEDSISGVESESSYEYKIYDENDLEIDTIDTSKTGIYKVKYTFKDQAGNEDTKTRKVEISATAPTIEFIVEEGILNSSNWAKGNFQVTINVTDNTGHGIKEFKVCTATTDRCDPTTGSTITNKTTEVRDIILEGANRICVQATDNYNQTSDTECSDVYYLDKTLPTVTYSVLGGTYNEYKTIRITPSDTNYSYMKVHTYKDGVMCDDKSFHYSKVSYYDVTLDEEGSWIVYVKVYDKAGNIQNQEPIHRDNWYYQEYTIDTTEPTLDLSKETYIEGFEGWSLENGAYLENGILYLPQVENKIGVWSPHIVVNNENWDYSFDAYVENPSTKYDPYGGIHGGTYYYDSNLQLYKNPETEATSNGHGKKLQLNTWTSINSFIDSGYKNISAVRLVIWSGTAWSVGPIQIKNFKIKGQLYNDFYNININKSDDVVTVKYGFGNYDVSAFSNGGGTTIAGEVLRVTKNGTYTIYVKDKAGNEAVATIEITNIDATKPNLTLTTSVNDSDTTQEFIVKANVTESPSGYYYSWYKDNVSLNHHENTYSIDGVGTYKVRVTNGKGNVEEKEIVINTYENTVVDNKNQLTVMGTMNSGNTCVLKGKYSTYTKEIPYDINTCTLEVANNLVKNGDLEYKDNTQYATSGMPIYNEEGSVIYSNPSHFGTFVGDMIEVDPMRVYEQTLTIKATKESSINYAGFVAYDVDKLMIDAYHTMYMSNSLTTLAQDLKDGDTVVYLESVQGFVSNSDLQTYQLGLIFWNYQDSTGYQYPEETYSRNIWDDLYTYDSINFENNTITLKQPWNHGTIVSGTKLSQTNSGGHNYGLFAAFSLGTEYQTYTNILSGYVQNQYHYDAFSYGTKYIRPYIILNYYSRIGDIDYYIKETSLKVIEESNQTYEFGYTETSEEFIAPKTGLYKLEVWGAQGGASIADYNEIDRGGPGGYSYGIVQLNQGDKLYVTVGGKGGTGSLTSCSLGGFNGGGMGSNDSGGCSTASDNEAAGGGGGATHIAITPGVLSSLYGYKSAILIVAGGGGGSIYSYSGVVGGAGGGLTGGITTYTTSNYPTRHKGYAFGQGQDGMGSGDSDGVAGGGGGYFGGYAENIGSRSAGTGGSGYVQSSGLTLSGNELIPDYRNNSLVKGNYGDGYARITLLD